MNTLLITALLSLQPLEPATPPLASLFGDQNRLVLRDIRIDIQADLEKRGAEFFDERGGLRRQLDSSVIVQAELAAR